MQKRQDRLLCNFAEGCSMGQESTRYILVQIQRNGKIQEHWAAALCRCTEVALTPTTGTQKNKRQVPVWHWELQCMPLVGKCTIAAETMRFKCISTENNTAHSDIIHQQSKIPSESYLIMRSDKECLIQYQTVAGQLEMSCAFVCLFVRKQDYTNPTELMYVKCHGGEGNDLRKIPLLWSRYRWWVDPGTSLHFL